MNSLLIDRRLAQATSAPDAARNVITQTSKSEKHEGESYFTPFLCHADDKDTQS